MGCIENKFVRHLEEKRKGEITIEEFKDILKTFRLTKKDLIPICKDLERDGVLKRVNHLKIKITRKLI